MNELFQNFFLGITQGITEFLPISSSAHLVLIPYLFRWPYAGLQFDIALHLGSALAIVLYFSRDWLTIIKNAWAKVKKQPVVDSRYPDNLLLYIVLGTIPAGITGFLIADYVEEYFHSPLLLSVNLAVFGLIILLVDKFTPEKKYLNQIKFRDSMIVGIAQALALIPGVSRAGITMMAGRSLGLNRETAARFSFLLGAPAMVGAFLSKIPDLTGEPITLPFLVGVVASFLSALLAINFLLKYLSKRNFTIFAVYRFILAGIVAAVFILR